LPAAVLQRFRARATLTPIAVPLTKFPANREFFREFPKVRTLASCDLHDFSSNDANAPENSRVAEQGISPPTAGNFSGLSGKLK
jgi:hypothetical protein